MNTLRLCCVLLTFGLCLPAQAALRVLACEPEWAALSQAIGGTLLEVDSATTAAQDPHQIEARPSLIALARRADLLVCTGADLEVGWLPLLLSRSGNTAIQVGAPGHFLAAQQVELLETQTKADRSLGDVHPAGNPHLQLDPRRMLRVAAALTTRLSALDPGNAAAYEANRHGFEQRITALLADLEGPMALLQGRRIVVDHNAWVYLADWLHLEQLATIEPIPGVPPSSAHLAGLLTRLGQQQVDLIVHSTYLDPRPAEWLANRLQLRPTALQLNPPDWQAPEALPQWYRHLVEVLAAGLHP